MSDAAGGFGSGGVSGRLTVEAHPENDDSCTRASKGFEKPVFFFIASPDNLTQCRTTVLSWNESIAQGYVATVLFRLSCTEFLENFDKFDEVWGRNPWQPSLSNTLQRHHYQHVWFIRQLVDPSCSGDAIHLGRGR